MWYVYALIGPAIWGFLNHVDKYLLGRFFKGEAAGPVLTVFTGFAGILVAALILLFGPPVFTLAPGQAFFVMLAGVLMVGSYVPYMIALQRDETSIVASLYRLTPVFVFALSYVVLGESLRPRQIVGGLVVIAGSILLIVDPDRRGRGLRFSTFFLMCLACLMNACTVVIFKTVALNGSFWRTAFWQYVGTGLFSLAVIGLVPSYRRALLTVLRSGGAAALVPMTLSAEGMNLVANLAVNFAGLIAPLALVSIVTGLHPLFVFAYGVLFTLFLPRFGRESLGHRHILQRVIAIGVMCIGMIITFT